MTWAPTRLKYAARVCYGLGQPPKLSDSGIPILRATNVTRGAFTPDGLIFAAKKDLPLDRAPLLHEGEIIVVRSGAYTGDSAMVTHEWAGSAPGYDLRVTPVDAYARYLAYFLLSKAALDQVSLAKSRAAQPHLNAEDLGDVALSLPPIDEQRRIADFLDAETSRIDVISKKKRQMADVLENRAMAVINQVCPGRIILGKDGRPVGLTGARCVRLGALSTIEPGFTMDAGRKAEGKSVTLPYLRVANVQDGALALGDIKEVTLPSDLAARCTLRRGDVLMTEGGDPDKLGRGTVWTGELEPCLHQNAIFAIRPDTRLVPAYLALVTRTPYARTYFEMTATKSTGIAHTSSTKITGFRIPLPTLAEQNRTVDRVNESLETTGRLRRTLAEQVDRLAERRRALITAAVSGQIDVTTARGGAG